MQRLDVESMSGVSVAVVEVEGSVVDGEY